MKSFYRASWNRIRSELQLIEGVKGMFQKLISKIMFLTDAYIPHLYILSETCYCATTDL